MRVTFRVDASLQIGIGHVMRCLTLADALMARGADCQFICRAHEGNLIEFIRGKGYVVYSLPVVQTATASLAPSGSDAHTIFLAHGHWLGATQAQDAEACAPILTALRPNWLIVDNYALDARWEQALAAHYGQLMVIDDLADRPHACELLLDQTFGRAAEDYRAWVPSHCQLLCGSRYALLRPEFAALRPYSLKRRAEPKLCHLLITMGGVDKDNATGQILAALRDSPLPVNCQITVVMGTTAPWLAEVARLAQDMPWPTQVQVGVANMAQLMADSDLAIGAAGATSWERCCLGLPTIMLVLADNQQQVAQGLEQEQAVRVIKQTQDIASCLLELLHELIEQPISLEVMSQSAIRIVDGQGLATVIDLLELLRDHDFATMGTPDGVCRSRKSPSLA